MMSEATKTRRVVSIDALRGFDMFWIIGGDQIFPALLALTGTGWAHALSVQFEHQSWNGFHFYDLIFPLFLFIVGAAMPFSLGRRLERGDTPRQVFRHILQRALILILLGLICNGLFNLDFIRLRYAGVLQRIGITYFFAAIIFMKWKAPRIQMMIGGIVLLLYWALLTFVPVPGYGMNILTPQGNLAGYIDRLLLPGSFCCYEFGDNEGILSTFPAIVHVLIGIQAGHLLRTGWSDARKTGGLILAGAGCLIAGLLWNLIFPINKLIWTSSYVLYSGGWSLLLLALFYWMVDVKGWRTWAFVFVVIGMNPITIYVAQHIIHFHGIANFFIRGLAVHLGPVQALFTALSVFAVKWLFLYFLFRKKIFLKV